MINKLRRSRKLFKIRSEILEVKDTLKINGDGYSQYKIFPYGIQTDKTNKATLSQLLFNSYRYYYLVKDFYQKLFNRDLYLSHTQKFKSTL
jgi:hypothetical protein